MDGKYKAQGELVVRAPTQTKTGFKMGFVLCRVSEHMDTGAAEEIAEAMNMHMERYPEKH